MSDHTTRVLAEDELRAANTLFHAALHVAPDSDERWPHTRRGYQPGRTLGVFDEQLIGTARSTDSELAVPGGVRVPLAAVTGVGVRADRTRRGVLTELMRAQFADFTDRGVVAAILHATEGVIYERFGYGVATLGRSYTVDRRRAALRPEVPAGGEMELLDGDVTFQRLPEIYAGLRGSRPGRMSRSEYWWAGAEAFLTKPDTMYRTAVHHGADGPDGYVMFSVRREPGGTSVLSVEDLHAADGNAFAGLWRFLLGVDLVDEIRLVDRAVDEPVELLFTDPRACRVTAAGDETWLRLVDVPGALSARHREGEPVVLEVVDRLLPGNTGRYRMSEHEVTRTDAPAQLRLDVATLAMIHLGAWLPSALASVGRIEVLDRQAVDAADRMFATQLRPWCGTFF
jgi:predicted acetyltransferase